MVVATTIVVAGEGEVEVDGMIVEAEVGETIEEAEDIMVDASRIWRDTLFTDHESSWSEHLTWLDLTHVWRIGFMESNNVGGAVVVCPLVEQERRQQHLRPGQIHQVGALASQHQDPHQH